MNGVEVLSPLARETEEIRQSWQGKALAYTRGKMAAVMMSVVAHNIGDAIAMKTLLRILFPGFMQIALPFFCTPARISHSGRITAHMIDRDGHMQQNRVVFKDEADMQKQFRTLADELALNDIERVGMFLAVRNWIVADLRQNPITGEKDVA